MHRCSLVRTTFSPRLLSLLSLYSFCICICVYKANRRQKGDTVPITRRISDIPVSQQTGRAGDAGEGFNVGQTAGEGQTAEEEDQEMLRGAQEMVGKALGGGSRGIVFILSNPISIRFDSRVRGGRGANDIHRGELKVKKPMKKDIANARPCM